MIRSSSQPSVLQSADVFVKNEFVPLLAASPAPSVKSWGVDRQRAVMAGRSARVPSVVPSRALTAIPSATTLPLVTSSSGERGTSPVGCVGTSGAAKRLSPTLTWTVGSFQLGERV